MNKALILTISMMLICIIGCAKNISIPKLSNGNPIENFTNFPESDDKCNSRLLSGIWKVEFDLENNTATITPCRDTLTHYNVKSILPPPQITIISYDPGTNIVSVDVKISNPFFIDGYDLRLIIYTDNAGHKLLNADDWTALYDIPGGLPINPFKAYAKHMIRRIFLNHYNWTENLLIYLPNSNPVVSFAIDVSYPGNCEEPYEISDFTQDLLYDEPGSSTAVQVSVFDWQDDVDSVVLYCPEISGSTFVPFNHLSDNLWETTLINSENAPLGEYFGYIKATSSNSGFLALYDQVTIVVNHKASGWARTWSRLDYGWAFDVAVDPTGDIYVSGYFKSTTDFDPGPGEDIHQSNSGSMDCFLSKFNTEGDFIWARTWGGNSFNNLDVAYAVAFDEAGNVYVIGDFWRATDLDPGPGEDIHVPNGSKDIFFSKFDPGGNYIWGLSWGGEYAGDSGFEIAIDKNDNIYIAGTYSGTADFDPGSGEDIHSANDSNDAFLSKFNPDGIFVWARSWGGTDMDGCRTVAIDKMNDIYIAGHYKGTADFDPGPGEDIHTYNGGMFGDIFLSKFNADGDFQFARTWGSPNDVNFWFAETGDSICVDEFNDIYVAGTFNGTCDFDPGPGVDQHVTVDDLDCFLSKFTPGGDFKWALTWGGYYGFDSLDSNYGLAIDKMNNIYVAGRFTSSVDFDPGPGEDRRNVEGVRDNFLSKFNKDGEFIWVRTWLNENMGDLLKFNDVAIDDYGNIFVASGYEGESVDFDPGPGEDIHTNNAIFLTKLLPNGYWE